MKTLRLLLFIVAGALGALLSSPVWAQEGSSSKDDTLEKLLKKLESAPEGGSAPDAKTKADEPSAPKGDQSKAKKTDEGSSKPSKSGEVGPKDKDLDDLLEKLGGTRDAPTPESRPDARPKPSNGPGQEGSAKDNLKGDEKDLDEHLAELLGRKKKKPQDQGGGEGKGPLSDIIKEMREVEKRLSEPDTGEETRKKEERIVKNLQELIEQMRASSSQGQARRIRQIQQAGQKQGDQQGSQGAQAGSNARGVGPMKPARPPEKSILANGKDVWGHLPPELRAEIANSEKEEALPDRMELIDKYYLSLSKKAKARQE
jgi:hypothetical protein